MDQQTVQNTLSEEELLVRRQLLTLWERMAEQISRLFLKQNILVPELEKILRWSASRAALMDPAFAIPGRDAEYQQTFSHAAVLTGLSRQEMSEIAAASTPPVAVDGGSLHRMIRILAAWRTEPGYQNEDGQPIDIPLRGGSPSFHALCRLHGRDTPTRPIADMLVKNGNAEWVGNGRPGSKKLRYVHSVVTADLLTTKGMEILTQISSDYTHTLQALFDPESGSKPRLRESYYNDIAVRNIEAAQEFLHNEMQAFCLRCTEGLKQFRAREGEESVRMGIGSYSFKGAPLLLERDGEQCESDIQST